MLERVRRAVRVADTFHAEDSAQFSRLLRAAERYREAGGELLTALAQLRLDSEGAEAAQILAQHRLTEQYLCDILLRSLLDPSNTYESEIHTRTPAAQIN